MAGAHPTADSRRPAPRRRADRGGETTPMMGAARVRAQAKVNLFLRILAREASGYHALETLFARLELADEVSVQPTAGPRTLECVGAEVGPPEKNLAWRAAQAYANAAGWPRGFEIRIEKRIPVGGGLGGGSADAGAVLRALNALAPRPLRTGKLIEIAGTLGADVPFMTLDTPLALGWSRGDRLLALPPLPAVPVALITFPFGVSSAEAYGWVAESRAGRPGAGPARALGLAALGNWEAVAALAENDFEDEVGRRHPQIAEVLETARARGAGIALLSGSGSTVFVIEGDGSVPPVDELPDGAAVLRTRTAFSVEDVVVTG